MRETTIRERLDETRAELARIEAEYRVLQDLTSDYARWLAVLGLPLEPAGPADQAEPPPPVAEEAPEASESGLAG